MLPERRYNASSSCHPTFHTMMDHVPFQNNLSYVELPLVEDFVTAMRKVTDTSLRAESWTVLLSSAPLDAFISPCFLPPFEEKLSHPAATSSSFQPTLPLWLILESSMMAFYRCKKFIYEKNTFYFSLTFHPHLPCLLLHCLLLPLASEWCTPSISVSFVNTERDSGHLGTS